MHKVHPPSLSLLSQFSSVQSLSHLQLFATPWTAAYQASLPVTISWSLLKLMLLSWWCHPKISSCRLLLLLPSVFPSIRVFSNESGLHIRWPKYWSFSFSISRSNEYSRLISLGLTSWISLQSKGLLKSLLQNNSSKASTPALRFLYGPTLTA